jgi:hypothetical protein
VKALAPKVEHFDLQFDPAKNPLSYTGLQEARDDFVRTRAIRHAARMELREYCNRTFEESLEGVMVSSLPPTRTRV